MDAEKLAEFGYATHKPASSIKKPKKRSRHFKRVTALVCFDGNIDAETGGDVGSLNAQSALLAQPPTTHKILGRNHERSPVAEQYESTPRPLVGANVSPFLARFFHRRAESLERAVPKRIGVSTARSRFIPACCICLGNLLCGHPLVDIFKTKRFLVILHKW